MSGESVLVVGATGFIGSHLAGSLAGDFERVLCLALRDRGQHHRTPPDADLVIAESATADDLRRALKPVRPDVVINLAAAGVSVKVEDPDELVAGNVNMVTALLTALESSPPRLFLQAGSWSEYAPAPPGVAVTESHPLAPTSLYGAAKAAASLVGNALARRMGIPFVTMRIFHGYGPGEAPSRLVPDLITRLQNHQPVDLTPGNQVRDFVHVDDVAGAFAVATRPGVLEPLSTYNICSGIAVSVRQVAESVADIMRKPHDLLLFGSRPHRSDEPLWMVGDGRRFENASGWHPSLSLEEGIRRTVAVSER